MDVPPRKRGRPSLEAARRLAAHVTIRLTEADYATVYRAAKRDRSSIAELLRKTLRRHGKI